MKLRAFISFCFLAVAMPSLAETTVTLDGQTDLGITIYNDNLALVRDSRRLSVPAGRSTVLILDVSAQIRAETALLEGNQFEVLEQNFDFDLLTPQKLLEKAVGQTVRLYRENPATGAETVETATILSTNGGTVLQIGDRIEVMGPLASIPGRIVFDKIPDNLRAKPTLSMAVHSTKARSEEITLNYLSGGLGWKADYVAYLSDEEDEVSLQGWVTLSNHSGTSFNDAKVQLVAGDINIVEDNQPMADRQIERIMVSASRAPTVEEEQLFEYHLYTLPNRTSVANQQTKQISFVEAPHVGVDKELRFEGKRWYYRSKIGEGEIEKARIFVIVDNKESKGLGKPLPKGIMRLYKADSKGTAQFIGEDRINHTAKNEEIKLFLGDAFDVSLIRKQTAFAARTSSVSSGKLREYSGSYELIIKNGKKESATVKIVEPMYVNWSITEESHPHVQYDAFTAVWTIGVPAEGETKLTYSVLTKESQ